MMSAIMDVAWLKPERKLRRKLQKLDSRPNSSHVTATDGIEHWAPDTRRSFFRSRRPSRCQSMIVPEKPSLSTSSVVVDNNNNNMKQPEKQPEKSEGPPQSDNPPNCSSRPPTSHNEPVPEFAHLRVGGRSSERPARNNSMSVRPLSLPPAPSTGPRRYAKTPVSRIGQLESSTMRRSTTMSTTTSTTTQREPRKVPSIERIAESYRKLLDPYNTIFKDTQVDVPGLGQASPTSDSTPSLDGMPSTPSDRSTERNDHVIIRGSPGSDAGTLVGFEDDGIYSRSIPYTAEPPLAAQKRHEPRLRRSTGRVRPVRNPRLEISLDLLTQELASAVRGTHWRPGSETSALQIWVMIEAYEKLRDQLQENQQRSRRNSYHSAGRDEVPLEMFDMWLKALHRIHDQMTGGHGNFGESG